MQPKMGLSGSWVWDYYGSQGGVERWLQMPCVPGLYEGETFTANWQQQEVGVWARALLGVRLTLKLLSPEGRADLLPV